MMNIPTPIRSLFFQGYWIIIVLIMLIPGFWILISRSVSIYSFTLDDSFITYRYAKHLAEGIGIIWNREEIQPVEGFTSFLWVIVNAFFEFFRFDPIHATKFVSFFSLLLILPLLSLTPYTIHYFFSYYRLPNLNLPPASKTPTACHIMLIGGFVASAMMVIPETPVHIVSGMETMFASLLLLLFAMSLAYFKALPKRVAIILPAILGVLCGLIRPEFNLGVGLGFVALWFIQYFGSHDLIDNQYHLSKKPSHIFSRRALLAALLYIGLALIYYVWRYLYYGLPFPLPFYIKQLQPSDTLFKGLPMMIGFSTQYFAFIGLALVGVAMNPRQLLPPFVVGLAVFIYFYFPEHIMGIHFRFVFPLLPLMLWFTTVALHRALYVHFLPNFLWILSLPLVVGTLIIGVSSNQQSQSHRYIPSGWQQLPLFNAKWYTYKTWLDDYRTSAYRSLIPLGQSIAKDQGPKMKIAMVDLGAVSYYGDWDMIDLFGLTHPKLAVSRSRGQYNADMLLNEAPDIILLGEFYRERAYRGQFAFERMLYQRMNHYDYDKTARFIWNSNFGFLVFARTPEVRDRFINILYQTPEIKPFLEDLRNG